MDMEFVYNYFVRRDNKVLLNSNAFKPAQSINQTPPTAKLSSQMMVNLSLSLCSYWQFLLSLTSMNVFGSTLSFLSTQLVFESSAAAPVDK